MYTYVDFMWAWIYEIDPDSLSAVELIFFLPCVLKHTLVNLPDIIEKKFFIDQDYLLNVFLFEHQWIIHLNAGWKWVNFLEHDITLIFPVSYSLENPNIPRAFPQWTISLHN